MEELYAFPFELDGEKSVSPGMTLRDYFAAKAMQSFLDRFHASGNDMTQKVMSTCAIVSYGMADAMLRARETTDE